MAYYKARPTIYKGIQMRSRLEAKYAATLDDKGLRWKYEPVCYASSAGQYLPDFQVWLTSGRTVFVEVKPEPEWFNRHDHLEKMHIIRASVPEALLAVWVENKGLHVCTPEGDERCRRCVRLDSLIQSTPEVGQELCWGCGQRWVDPLVDPTCQQCQNEAQVDRTVQFGPAQARAALRRRQAG